MTCTFLDTGAILRAREAGATYAELMDMFGIGYSQLRNVLRMHGKGSPKRRERTRVPADVQALMCELRDAGWSRREVAIETGWSEGAVDRAVERRSREARR